MHVGGRGLLETGTSGNNAGMFAALKMKGCQLAEGGLAVVLLLCGLPLIFPAMAAEGGSAVTLAAFQGHHLADYNSELRGADGHVDADALLARLKELGVTTYYWLIWHAPTDWEDLKLFLPKARAADMAVWVYLVPPTESPPLYGSLYSEPYRLDYLRWAEEIARLSLQFPNLTAWVMDDFYANRKSSRPLMSARCSSGPSRSIPTWPSCRSCTSMNCSPLLPRTTAK